MISSTRFLKCAVSLVSEILRKLVKNQCLYVNYDSFENSVIFLLSISCSTDALAIASKLLCWCSFHLTPKRCKVCEYEYLWYHPSKTARVILSFICISSFYVLNASLSYLCWRYSYLEYILIFVPRAVQSHRSID